MGLVPGAAMGAITESPHDLIKDMVYNELQDRARPSYWLYHMEVTENHQTKSEEQVETAYGPVYRLLAIDGKPLTPVQQKIENDREADLLRDPNAQAAVKRRFDADEQRLERLMQMMPEAFVFEYDGEPQGDLVALKYQPNPRFDPPTYEARVFHALAGTVWVDLREKRLRRLVGTTTEDVDFGLGILGRVEKGGRFEVERQPVSGTHWKTALVDVKLRGRLVFFKTISKDEREIRSDFRPVNLDTTVAQAEQLLGSAPSGSASLGH